MHIFWSTLALSNVSMDTKAYALLLHIVHVYTYVICTIFNILLIKTKQPIYVKVYFEILFVNND